MPQARFALFFLGIISVLPAASAQPAPVKGHTALVHAVAVSPDGKTLATAGFDNVVKLWDIAPDGALKEKKVLIGHTGPVYAVAFHPTDPKLIATASQDKTARIWDMTDGKMKTEFKGHTDIVDTIAFSPDGKSLATAGADKSVKLWNQADGKELKSLGTHDGSVYAVAFSPDSKLLASAGVGKDKDNPVKIWDVKDQKELTQLKGHEQPVTAVAFTDNESVVTVSMDRTIRTWTTKGGKEPKVEPKEPKEPKVDPKDVKKDPKVDPKVDPKDVKKDPPKEMKDPKELKKFGPTVDDPYAIAWDTKSKTLAVCGYSGQITTWSLDADKPKFTKAIKNPGYCIAFTADGKAVITGHDNCTVAFTPLGK